MAKLSRFFLVLLVVTTLSCGAKAASVSGTVGYPDDTDVSLLTSTSTVIVYLDLFSNANGTGYIARQSSILGIPAGTLTTNFNLTVATEILGQTPRSYRISYGCNISSTPNNICSTNENSNPRFTGLAWYTEAGMVPNRDDGQLYSVDTSLTDVPVRFLRRPTARGTIALPAPLSVNESFQVRLKHYNNAGDFPAFFSDAWSASYLVGSSATEFDYLQPSNFVDQGFYTIEVSCNTAPNQPARCRDFLSQAYYKSSGSVTKQNDAERIPFDANLNDRDFSILAGKLLSLTLKLPNNALPTSEFSVTVRVEKLDSEGTLEGSYIAQNNFTTSDNSQLFEIRLPPDETEGSYRISYDCFDECENYFPEGYFNTAGTRLEQGDATLLPYSDGLTGLEMVMLRGQRFSGELSFPGAATASELTPNFIRATLLDDDCNAITTVQSTNLAINAGQRSRSYVLDIPRIGQRGYLINYACAPESVCTNSGYAGVGWVGATAISEDASQATFFATNKVPETLDITLVDTTTPENNLEYPEIGGQCAGVLCLPIKTTSGAAVLICL